MAVSADHRIEYRLDELERHVWMEEVGHRIHEDKPRPLPLKRLVEPLRSELEIEPSLIRVAGNSSKAFGKRLGVAMSAAGAHLGTTGHGIPGRFGPFDQ